MFWEPFSKTETDQALDFVFCREGRRDRRELDRIYQAVAFTARSMCSCMGKMDALAESLLYTLCSLLHRPYSLSSQVQPCGMHFVNLIFISEAGTGVS